MFSTILKTNTVLQEIAKTQKRIIMHIDFDSFFASVEQQANPLLRGKPIAVTGSSLTKGIACAASREAKKYGVKTAMPLFKARELCPQLIAVKGDGSKYTYISKKSHEIFKKFSDKIEPFSIDESFVDITDTAKFWNSPEEIAKQIKAHMKEEFGEYITCSIGIGPNKLMAKLVSDYKKPNGLFVVNETNLAEVLESAELQDFCGIGPRIYARLNKIGVFSVAELQKIPWEILYREFGNIESTFLKNLSFGIDHSPVAYGEYQRDPKSIGHQHTLEKNTANLDKIKNNLRRLTEMAAFRMRKHNTVASRVHFFLRDKNFKSYHEGITLGNSTENSGKIFKAVEGALDSGRWRNHLDRELRLVGITLSGLTKKENLSYNLFDMDKREERLVGVADTVNNRFGNFTLIPANTLIANKTKGKISSFLRH